MHATPATGPIHAPDPTVDAVATIVVGAGIGGLLAAIAAADAHPSGRVVVLDPHPPGGRGRVDDRGGFRFNRGPRALYRRGPAERALRSVGVATDHGGTPHLGGAIALAGGRAHPFPGGALSSARTSLLSAREKLEVARAVAALWRADEAETDGRTVSDWLDDRRLAGRARGFVEALVRVASYANAPDSFAAGPALAQARMGMRPGVRYLDGGFQSLVDQLEAIADARGVRIVPVGARAVVPEATSVRVLADGMSWEATSVVLAVGGPEAAAALLPDRPASWGELAPPVTAACLELGVRGLPAHRFALGIDEPTYGSTHAPPADLAPPDHAVVHLMRYRPVEDPLPVEQQRARLDAVARHMGIEPSMVVEARFLPRMVVTGSLPTAGTGGLAGRPPVAVDEHPGVLLAGDWVGSEGLLLDAVAASAMEAGRLAAVRSATMVGA